jgi:hypothetical protein
MCGRRGLRFALAGAVILSCALAAAAQPIGEMPGLLQIQITGTGGSITGTCFLIHRDTRADGITMYFMTASQLFDLERLGERQTRAVHVRISLGTSNIVETSGVNVVFPAGVEGGLDLAVVKAIVSSTSIIPVAVSLEPPALDETFLIRGYRRGELTLLGERVRFRSTRLATGHRTAMDVTGLIGSPAMTERGVFGVLTECSATRAPVITLLSAAAGFLARALPGLDTR